MAGSVKWADTFEPYQNWLIVSNKSARTVEVRLYHVTRFANAMTVGPQRIEPNDIIGYLARPEWAPNTRNVCLSSLSSFFQWSKQFGITETDPTLPLKPAPVTQKAPNPPTRKEINRALATAEPRTQMMIRLAADVGLKPMEIARCHTRDLQQNDDGDYVLRAVSMTGKVRMVNVPPSLAEDIAGMPNGFLFPGRMDGHVSPAYVSRLVSEPFGPEVTAEVLRHASEQRSARSWREVPSYHAAGSLRITENPDLADSRAIQQQLRRIARDIERDPASAISECKNLLESLFKYVLAERGTPPTEYVPLSPMFKLVAQALAIDTESVEGEREASSNIGTIMDGLVTTVAGVNRTRNVLGTGHGHGTASPAEPRHSYLAFNATVAVAEYIADTWQDRKSS